MILADVVEQKKEALRVEDIARILDISVKQIYKMAAKGQIPSLKIANCVRFDPHEVAGWRIWRHLKRRCLAKFRRCLRNETR